MPALLAHACFISVTSTLATRTRLERLDRCRGQGTVASHRIQREKRLTACRRPFSLATSRRRGRSMMLSSIVCSSTPSLRYGSDPSACITRTASLKAPYAQQERLHGVQGVRLHAVVDACHSGAPFAHSTLQDIMQECAKSLSDDVFGQVAWYEMRFASDHSPGLCGKDTAVDLAQALL